RHGARGRGAGIWASRREPRGRAGDCGGRGGPTAAGARGAAGRCARHADPVARPRAGSQDRGRRGRRRGTAGPRPRRPPARARVGAVLVFDEIKTAFRLAIGGAAERYGVRPDLTVLGKALANGFPLAVVGGREDLMSGVARTWISSTLATESVALAAAQATVDV